MTEREPPILVDLLQAWSVSWTACALQAGLHHNTLTKHLSHRRNRAPHTTTAYKLAAWLSTKAGFQVSPRAACDTLTTPTPDPARKANLRYLLQVLADLAQAGAKSAD
jgi:hypothetical protein